MPCHDTPDLCFLPMVPFHSYTDSAVLFPLCVFWASLPLAIGCVDPVPMLMAQRAVLCARHETVQPLTLVIGSWSCRTSLFISITSVICAWTCPEQHTHTTSLSSSWNQKRESKAGFSAWSGLVSLNTKLVGTIFAFKA